MSQTRLYFPNKNTKYIIHYVATAGALRGDGIFTPPRYSIHAKPFGNPFWISPTQSHINLYIKGL